MRRETRDAGRWSLGPPIFDRRKCHERRAGRLEASRPVLGVLMLLLFAACGAAENGPAESTARAPLVQVQFDQAGGWHAASAATAPARPVTLVLALSGPDGALHEAVAYAQGEVRIPDLREGRWSLRGDGLDQAGQVTWTAAPVNFDVYDGKKAAVKLAFRPLE